MRCCGKFNEAIKLLEKCLKQFEINDLDIFAKIYLEMGLNAFHMHNLIKALKYFKDALIIYESVNWKLDIARVLNRLSMVLA